MRTTLDLDDELVARAQALFPAGTPKTVLLEEALRRMVDRPQPASVSPDPRIAALNRAGLLSAPTVAGPLPRGPAPEITLAQLLADLAADREDR